jgi:hypothetical protein
MSEAHDFGGCCCLAVGIGFVFDFHLLRSLELETEKGS